LLTPARGRAVRLLPATVLASGLLVTLGAASSTTAGSGGGRFRTGSARDVAPPLFGPAYDLAGGADEVDTALQWLLDTVRGCRAPCPRTLDVVVVRSSGADGYNPWIAGMDGVDSVETLVVSSRRDADDPAVIDTVERAEVVFFGGGDPCDYARVLGGSRLSAAVQSVHARGGGIAGTSAGLGVQGEFTHDACADSVRSADALADPYDRRVRLAPGPFRWPFARGLVADAHFAARDRMGRAMAFVARQVQDGHASPATALAVDEGTAVVLDRTSRGAVLGASAAYVVRADHVPEVCRPGRPLTYSGFKVWKIPAGRTMDLARLADGYYTVSVVDGRLSADPY
jgi:cyanophycinase-like exopeptidase